MCVRELTYFLARSQPQALQRWRAWLFFYFSGKKRGPEMATVQEVALREVVRMLVSAAHNGGQKGRKHKPTKLLVVSVKSPSVAKDARAHALSGEVRDLLRRVNGGHVDFSVARDLYAALRGVEKGTHLLKPYQKKQFPVGARDVMPLLNAVAELHASYKPQ